MGDGSCLPDTVVSQRPASGMGQAAAYAARAAVRGPLAGHRHPTLAGSSGRNDLLRLSAVHGTPFATDSKWLRPIRVHHNWLAELRTSSAASTGGRAAACGGAESCAQGRNLGSPKSAPRPAVTGMHEQLAALDHRGEALCRLSQNWPQ